MYVTRIWKCNENLWNTDENIKFYRVVPMKFDENLNEKMLYENAMK